MIYNRKVGRVRAPAGRSGQVFDPGLMAEVILTIERSRIALLGAVRTLDEHGIGVDDEGSASDARVLCERAQLMIEKIMPRLTR